MKKMIILLLGLMGSLFSLSKVEAVLLEEQFINGVYYVETAPDGSVHIEKQAFFYLDGKFAYCLEPEVSAKAGEYEMINGLDSLLFSEKEKEKIEEYGYYGYEYPGHQRIEYYLAAQELIWELVSDYEITWVNARSGGSEIVIENEKNEILSLIEESKKLPSFVSSTIKVYEGEKLFLEDRNGVLNHFDILESFFKIDGNYITSNEIWEDRVLTGVIKPYDYNRTLLYRRENAQTLATLRLTKPVSFEMKIEVEGIPITIYKLGEKNNINNEIEWIEQSGVEFELYAEEDIIGHFGNIIYQKGALVEVLTTKDGYAKTKKLPYGKYYLIETHSLDGYDSSEVIHFEINNTVEKDFIIEVKNQLSTGKIKIIKRGADGSLLSGVIFGLYNANGDKIDERSTDENGEIVWERIPNGEYQIKELKTVEGYMLDDVPESVKVASNEIVIEKINIKVLPDTNNDEIAHIQIVIGFLGIGWYSKCSKKLFH